MGIASIAKDSNFYERNWLSKRNTSNVNIKMGKMLRYEY